MSIIIQVFIISSSPMTGQSTSQAWQSSPITGGLWSAVRYEDMTQVAKTHCQ